MGTNIDSYRLEQLGVFEISSPHNDKYTDPRDRTAGTRSPLLCSNPLERSLSLELLGLVSSSNISPIGGSPDWQTDPQYMDNGIETRLWLLLLRASNLPNRECDGTPNPPIDLTFPVGTRRGANNLFVESSPKSEELLSLTDESQSRANLFMYDTADLFNLMSIDLSLRSLQKHCRARNVAKNSKDFM